MHTNIETSDIILAATLKVLNYSLDRIERDGTRGIFHFSNVKDTDLMDYDLGRSRVEPVNFNNAIRALTTAARRAI